MSRQFHFEYMTEVPICEEGTTTAICTMGSPIEEESWYRRPWFDFNQNHATLEVSVRFDSEFTDGEGIARAFDRLLETAMSIPGIFDEYGNIVVDEFFVVPHSYHRREGKF